MFREGHESVENEHGSGHPSPSIDEYHEVKTKELLFQNRRMFVRELANEIGLLKTHRHIILTE